jgi:6-phosphogluconolactonase
VDIIRNAAADSIHFRGRFTLALAGGSTPEATYRALAGADLEHPLVGNLWHDTEVFWGDERCVPPDHEDSNYRMAREALLDHVPLKAESIHRIRGEDGPETAAEAYEDVLETRFPNGARPRLDLVILGLGEDGHTASLFPGTEALVEPVRWVVPARAPVAPHDRVTLTLPVLNQARRVLFLVSGEEKAEAYARAVKRLERRPANLVRPEGGEAVTWIVDEAVEKGAGRSTS